jgi:hypothetical protein
VEPFVLVPDNLVANNGKGSTPNGAFAQLPASMFTRIFGSSWLPNLPVQGGWNPGLPARTEGFKKGQATIADTMVYDNSSDTPDFVGKGL